MASWVDTWHLRLLGKKKNIGEGEKKGERRGGAGCGVLGGSSPERGDGGRARETEGFRAGRSSDTNQATGGVHF